MITLKNEKMSVVVCEHGAEMQSITAADGTEYLWNGDPAYWKGRAPVLFPICGRLKNNEYRLDGKTYPLGIHGFARDNEFLVETATDTEAVFLLRDTEETRKCYPFSFELRVKYVLNGSRIEVGYAITNTMADAPLYASIGSHEGYRCPEGLSAYEVVFEREEPLNSHIVGGSGLEHETYPVEAPNGVLPLRDEHFAVDAFVFRHLKSQAVTLRNRESGRGVKVEFAGAETLLIWSKPGAPFACIEPWCGLPSWSDFDGEFSEKEGICRIEAGNTFRVQHAITLLP